MRHRNAFRALIAGAATLVMVSGAVAAVGAGPALAATPRPVAGAPGPAVAGFGQTAVPTGAGPAGVRTVTLITGDRVTSSGSGWQTIAPRRGIQFLSYTDAGHRYVIPSDAVDLLRANRLDRRLFDITQLLADGYDRRGELPVIASGGASVTGNLHRTLASVHGFATAVRVDALATGWPATRAGLGAGKLWLDGLRKPTLDVSVPQIGAPAAWAAGYDGTGVTVAVLDTGIDATHPDLAGAVTAERNFTGGYEDDLDHVGHGTHVASTIAGTGAGSAGRYRGVAPGAKLLDGKVCAADGCAESWILAGMQWAAESGAAVVNMSLGGSDSPDVDPLEQAVNDLTARYGVLFVVAAGNAGSDESVGSPASADAALAVGAVSKTDQLAEFSSRGPRVGDHAVKPEITAPGVDIVAARSKDSPGTADQLYVSHSGTSMATPHVAGAAAILTQVHPQWTPEQRKSALMAAARPNPAIGVFAQGAGRVDVARAYQQTITTSPSSVSFGLQDYPHTDDAVLTRDVTYHNPTSEPVTLALALTTSAPAGMFTLSATSVTVPAGGDTPVTLTADTRVGGEVTGGLGGQVTATAAGISVQTPFGVVRDSRKVKVHLTVNDRAGAPAKDSIVVLINTTTGDEFLSFAAEETLSVLPGTYFAFSFVPDVNESVNLLVRPALDANNDVAVAMDGRQARGYDVTVPDPQAKPMTALVDVEQTVAGGSTGATVIGDSFANLYSANLGPSSQVPGLRTEAMGTFGRPDATGSFLNTTQLHQLGWYVDGSVFAGLTRHLKDRELATVRADYSLNAVGGQGARVVTGVIPGTRGGWGFGVLFDLPLARTEHFGGDLLWSSTFVEFLTGSEGFPQPIALTSGPIMSYVAGHRYDEHWNNAVFAPHVSAAAPGVFRSGDTIVASPSLYSDATGREGATALRSARTALYRNGTLVGESPSPGEIFTVPAGPARYRLEVSSDQAAGLRLSTTISSVWTFKSSHVDALTALPVIGLSFAASLDERNSARVGSVGVTPIVVSQQGVGGKVTTITVDVSYDDGATWHKAPVVYALGKWVLVLHHPNRAGFVSLRAQATDTAGNTVQQTVIRAYELR